MLYHGLSDPLPESLKKMDYHDYSLVVHEKMLIQPTLVDEIVRYFADDAVAVNTGWLIEKPDFALSELNRYHDTSPAV